MTSRSDFALGPGGNGPTVLLIGCVRTWRRSGSGRSSRGCSGRPRPRRRLGLSPSYSRHAPRACASRAVSASQR